MVISRDNDYSFCKQTVKCQGQEITTDENDVEIAGTTAYRVGQPSHIYLVLFAMYCTRTGKHSD